MYLTTREHLPEKQIIEGMEKCPNCQSPVFEGDEKCHYCGLYLNKPGFAVHGEGKKFGIRAGAYVIDMLVFYTAFYIVSIIAGIFIGIVFAILGRELLFDRPPDQCLNSFIGMAVFTSYFTIFEWLYGASPGKLVLRMRVVNINGEPCSLKAAFIRALLRLIDGILFGLPAYLNMNAPLYQRIGDKSANTIVVASSDAVIKQPRSWGWFLLAAVIVLIVNGAAALVILYYMS